MIKKQFTDPATIGTAELFCLNLNDIPNCQLKIKLMIEVSQITALLKINVKDVVSN